MTKKSLGKGLDALLSIANLAVGIKTVTHDDIVDKQHCGVARKQLLVEHIRLNLIKPGRYQPRQNFAQEEIAELANSIKANGIIQPIVLRKCANHYEIIAGERRYRACLLLAWEAMPAIVQQMNDQQALALSLVENLQRKDLNAIEEAEAYNRLLTEFSLTHDDLASLTGKSRSHVTNMLRLLKLPADIKILLHEEKLTMGHARALVGLSQEEQQQLIKKILEDKLTTAQLESHKKQFSGKSKLAYDKISNVKILNEITRLEESLTANFGMKAFLKLHHNGRGKLILEYNSIAELETMLNKFVALK